MSQGQAIATDNEQSVTVTGALYCQFSSSTVQDLALSWLQPYRVYERVLELDIFEFKVEVEIAIPRIFMALALVAEFMLDLLPCSGFAILELIIRLEIIKTMVTTTLALSD